MTTPTNRDPSESQAAIARRPAGRLWTIAAVAMSDSAGARAWRRLTPVVVGRVLKTPPYLLGEARTTFYILAASMPMILAASGLECYCLALSIGIDAFDCDVA